MREEKNVTDETESGAAEPTDLVLSDGKGWSCSLEESPEPLLLRAPRWKFGVGEDCPAGSGLGGECPGLPPPLPYFG